MTTTDHVAPAALAHLVKALDLAVGAAVLIDAPTDATIGHVQNLRTTINQLEISTTALLLSGGTTWEVMASAAGVKRQSLNRRLGRASKVWFNQAAREATANVRLWRRHSQDLADLVSEIIQINGPDEARRIARQLLTDR